MSAIAAYVVGPLAALLVIGLIVFLKSSAARKPALVQKKVRLLVHSINDDRCTGCDACVMVCPTDVLELRHNKSRVVRFEDCIQCEQCVHVCPTTALVMHYEGTPPPPVLVPELDEYYQSRVPGLYLLGEAAGKPLVKNAVNLGRAAVEHMLQKGVRPGGLGPASVDVVIVGSGPAGLSAALSCIQRGLSYVVLEKDAMVASTIARYPRGKKVMAEPYGVRCVGLLPVWDASKDDTIGEWNRILSQVNLDIRLREPVEDVRAEGSGRGFAVRTPKGVYRAQQVVLGIGTRGKPRRLGVPGEDLPLVAQLLDDPELYQGQAVLVVGGGDSAVEAAVALAERGLRNRVMIAYRGKQFNRVKARNREDLDRLVAEGRILLLLGAQVQGFAPRQAMLVLGDGRQKAVPIDRAFVLIGGDPPVKWLESLGIGAVQRPHEYTTPPTDQLVERLIGRQQNDNNRPGIPLAALGLLEQRPPSRRGQPGQPDPDATLLQDQGDLRASMRAAAARLQGLGDAGEQDKGVTIMVPKDQFLLHLPEKLHVEGEKSNVAALRRVG